MGNWFEKDGIHYRIINDSDVEVIENSDKRYSGDIVIPSTVTYKGKTYSVITIRKWAFSGCTGLTSVTIGNKRYYNWE